MIDPNHRVLWPPSLLILHFVIWDFGCLATLLRINYKKMHNRNELENGKSKNQCQRSLSRFRFSFCIPHSLNCTSTYIFIHFVLNYHSYPQPCIQIVDEFWFREEPRGTSMWGPNHTSRGGMGHFYKMVKMQAKIYFSDYISNTTLVKNNFCTYHLNTFTDSD